MSNEPENRICARRPSMALASILCAASIGPLLGAMQDQSSPTAPARAVPAPGAIPPGTYFPSRFTTVDPQQVQLFTTLHSGNYSVPQGAWLRTSADGSFQAFVGADRIEDQAIVQSADDVYLVQQPGQASLWLRTLSQGVEVPYGSTILFPPVQSMRGRIGIDVVPIEPALAKHLGLEVGQAIVVSNVEVGSPAFGVGLELYDVLVGLDGESPVTVDSLKRKLAGEGSGVGMPIELTVRRGPEELSIVVTPEVETTGSLIPFPIQIQPGLQPDWVLPPIPWPVTPGLLYPLPTAYEPITVTTSEPTEAERLATIEERLAALEDALREGLERITETLGSGR